MGRKKWDGKFPHQMSVDCTSRPLLGSLEDVTQLESGNDPVVAFLGLLELQRRSLAVQELDVDIEDFKFVAAREDYIVGDGGFPGAIKRHRVDVLVVSTASDIVVTFSALSETPAISLPLGFMPTGTPVKKR
ncbi:hypothetical protein VTL71DRAFT_15175 [Oculimacula yallundae]|uniref:Amidase domain-containing protein n=1 Tax=Oculimacula yallundae TaxID=86028 RepID=A0ABR4CH43_9HELO